MCLVICCIGVTTLLVKNREETSRTPPRSLHITIVCIPNGNCIPCCERRQAQAHTYACTHHALFHFCIPILTLSLTLLLLRAHLGWIGWYKWRREASSGSHSCLFGIATRFRGRDTLGEAIATWRQQEWMRIAKMTRTRMNNHEVQYSYHTNHPYIVYNWLPSTINNSNKTANFLSCLICFK